MKKIFFITAFILAATIYSSGQEKRALIIAIDTYSPPESYKPSSSEGRIAFPDLDGCVNDAQSIQSIITSRFQFNTNNVDTLFNTNATRDAILKQINALYDKSKQGDIAFLYYAGHGSQVKNSSSKEADKKDETMVPCDTWKAGVSDIRDKELAKLYNKFIDKGVKLTVIFDCCHSGSLSRGPQDPNHGKFRFIAEANFDAKDPSQPTPPETRKEGTFLIMSAAQDNEFAQEQRDDAGLAHGAFTIAFTEALNQQGVNASALNLFTSITAILKSNGKKQQPVLGGSSERQQQTLFGLAKGTISDKSMIAISGILPDGRIELQGGFALGLYKENELVKFNGKDTLVKVRVDNVTNINKSIASVIKGSVSDLKAGEFLEVTNWVSSAVSPLKIYIPSGSMSNDQVLKLAHLSNELKQSKKIRWINDLEKADPWMSVFYYNGKYYYNANGSKIQELNNMDAASILTLCRQDSTLYFELPPSGELADAIRERLKANANFALVNSADDANYVLYGTINRDGKPSYGLRKAGASSRDSLQAMPLMTTNFVQTDNNTATNGMIADSLSEYAMRLFKVRAWLQLTGPKKSKNDFPFHLELVNDATEKQVDEKGSKMGDAVTIYIVADKIVTEKNFNPGLVTTKYVYVFTQNKYGKMQLLYPGKSDGKVHNKFPQMYDDKIKTKVELIGYEVEPPSGTDNIFLLATDEPISTYGLLFDQDGVRDDAMRGDRGKKNPLEDILNIGAPATRDIKPKTPSNWVLYRMPVVSRY
jgi:hypothetical protein